MLPTRGCAGSGARALVASDIPDAPLQEVDPDQQQHASGPRRHEVLFASLFKPEVFPHFFRVFVECDIDVPSATAHTAPASDSGTSITISDEGFRKMAECYIVCNLAYTADKKSLTVVAQGSNGRSSAAEALQDNAVMYVVVKNSASDQRCTLCKWIGKQVKPLDRASTGTHLAAVQEFVRSSITALDEAEYETKNEFLGIAAAAGPEVPVARAASAASIEDDARLAAERAAQLQRQQEKEAKEKRSALERRGAASAAKLIDFVDAAAVSEKLASIQDGSDGIDWIVFGYPRERNSGAYSSENLSAFLNKLKSNKDKKVDDSESAAESKSAEAQPNPQEEYSKELLALVLSLPSENYPQATDKAQAVVAFSAVMASVLSTMPKLDRTDAFFSFCAWLLNHCTIPHQSTEPTSDKPSPHRCKAETIIHNFASHPDNHENFEHMVSLVRFCHFLRFWHRDSFAAKSQCIFELCYCSSPISMFNLCSEKDAARMLQECLKLINLDYLAPEARTPSPLTSRWILLAAGRSVKQWGHHSSHEFERCEVEKESNFCEKWRHLIYSYAIMSLLYNEFNGNKLGPIGNYLFREKCKIGPVGSHSEKFVYASKATKDGTPCEASDYLGHNIVALAVCKRGSVLRVSYNHNVLFSSTVDHAEERLIDGLFKDPSAFIEQSHAKIFNDGQRVNIEDHMKHISVYTSLEPCQQCSGKLHIAEVPELVFCQRDWDIQLLQAHLYEKFRKCRSIPASNFEFTPYQELSSGYYNFQSDRRTNFFSLEDRKVPTKATMPYFLCTDYAQMIFRLGHKVFEDDLKLLFLGGKAYTEDDLRKFADEDGLISAHEWLKQAENIRDYRPLLNRKQMRVLHDELSSSRVEWIQLCHKRECSVMMQFDPNSNVTEHEIDLNFASLVDIKSIYLPRDLDGSLKGSATLVCASPAAAKQFLALFKLSSDVGQGHIEENLDDKGEIAIKQKSDLSKLKKDFLKKAAKWMYLNRRVQEEELIVPFYSTDVLPDSDCSPAAGPSPRASASSHKKTALLVEWHHKRIANKLAQNKISQAFQSSESTTTSKKHLVVVSKPKKSKISPASQSSESSKKKLVVVSHGSNGRECAAQTLKDNAIMYIVVKNANGEGCTLCQWRGRGAPANQIQGSKKHPAQVQQFLLAFIRKVNFDRTQYNSWEDFQNPEKRDASSAKEAVHADSDKKKKKEEKAKAKAEKRDAKEVQAALEDICFPNCSDVSEELLKMDSGIGDDWMVFQYTDDTQWEEIDAVESPQTRKERLETALVELRTRLFKLRAESLLFGIQYEQKLANPQSDCPNVKHKTPLQRLGQQVFCFKADNAAQARRLRQMLPNLDAPNHTVLWSSSATSSVFSQTDGKGSTLSLIVRDDVTDASVVQFLQKILNTDLLPIIRSRSRANLRACDGNENGIKWLDINGTAIESRKWKLQSFQFRSRIEVERIAVVYSRYLEYFFNGDHKEFQWDSERFCQPFSQPVLDLIFLKADFQSFRKLKFDIKEMVEKHFPQKSDPPKHLLLTVTGSEKTHFFVSQNGNATSSKHVSDETRKKMKFVIEIDQNFLANFLFSDAFSNPLVKEKFKSILEYGENFWGGPISFKWNKQESQKSGHVVLKTSAEAEAEAEADDDKAKAEAANEFWEVLSIWRKRAVISVLEQSQPSSSQDSITLSGKNGKWPPPAEVVEIWCSEAGHACTTEIVSCCYCGCNYAIPQCVREALVGDQRGVLCCISHADREEKRTKLQMPISNFNKPDKVTHTQIQDPARDKNLAKLFQRICELEKLLLLNIRIGFQKLLYFKRSGIESSLLRIQCQFLRDEYDGPAHLSFCIEGPTDVLCQSRAKEKEPSAIEAPKKTISKKKADKTDYMLDLTLKEGLEVLISSSQPIDGILPFKTSLSVYPEFHERETPLCFGDGKQKIKTHMCRIYGRLAPKDNGTENGVATNNEGNKLPAEWMRRVMEPEYYLSSTAMFPVVKFELIHPDWKNYGAYVAESGLPYFEELGLNDKHSKQEDKTKKDAADVALSCFREVLNAENQLNAVTASLGPLNQRVDASLNGDAAAADSIGDECDDDDDVDDVDDDDNGDEDQHNGDSPIPETSRQSGNKIPKCVWVVFLRTSTKRGCWMELFHAPPFFSDIARVQLDFPAQPLEQGKPLDFTCFSRDQQALKNLSFESLVHFFKLIFKKGESSMSVAYKHARGFFEADEVFSSSSQEQEGRGCAASASPEHVPPLIFLAKSFMDRVMANTDHEASQIKAVPICVIMQNDFPQHYKNFLFDQMNPPTFTVTADVSATLSRSLPPKLDLSFQLEAKQKKFDDAIHTLLGVGVGQEDGTDYGSGALVACKTIRKSFDSLKLLEVFKYFLLSDDLFCKIRPDHINWLSEMGQQLERQCEFALALKYYYTGKVYYAKLNKFGSQPRGPDSKLALEGFRTDGLYDTMFQALQMVAGMEEHKDWAKKHWPSWATDDQKKTHLRECLNVSDDVPCLQAVQTVLENAAKHLSVYFHFCLLPGAARSNDPHVLLTYSKPNWKFECSPLPRIEVDEEKKHGSLRILFEQLFERLLPYSNKEGNHKSTPLIKAAARGLVTRDKVLSGGVIADAANSRELRSDYYHLCVGDLVC